MERDPDLISTGQAAGILACSRQHVVDLCERGDLAAVSVGTHRRVRRADVEALALVGAGATPRRRTRRPEQERSLWLHRAVVGRMVRDPGRVLDKARRNLERMDRAHPAGMSARRLARWHRIIDQGPEAVMRVLVAETEDADELRQNSPFAGVLPEAERLAVLRAVRRHTAGSTLRP